MLTETATKSIPIAWLTPYSEIKMLANDSTHFCIANRSPA